MLSSWGGREEKELSILEEPWIHTTCIFWCIRCNQTKNRGKTLHYREVLVIEPVINAHVRQTLTSSCQGLLEPEDAYFQDNSQVCWKLKWFKILIVDTIWLWVLQLRKQTHLFFEKLHLLWHTVSILFHRFPVRFQNNVQWKKITERSLWWVHDNLIAKEGPK